MKRRVVFGAMCIAAALAIAVWRRGGSEPEPRPTEERVRARDVAAPVRGSAAISGLITDKAGPIAGARVCAHLWSDELPRSSGRMPVCAVSDAGGRYAIAGLLAQPYKVSAAAAHRVAAAYREHDDSERQLVKLGEGEQRDGIDIQLENGGVELVATVTDLFDAPIAGAHVESAGACETDAAGRCSLWVRPGDATVSVLADGYLDDQETSRAPGTITIALEPEATIDGTVIDARTNAPVPGVEIEIAHFGLTAFGTSLDVSDSAGHFHLGRLRADRYSLVARGPHAFGASEAATLVALGEHVDGVTIKVHPAVRVEGRVQIAGNPPRPCPKPSLNLYREDRDESLYGRGRSDGSVQLDGVPPGSYQLRATCNGYVDPDKTKITIESRDVSGLVWTAQEGGSVRGRVMFRSGTPIAQCYLQLDGESDGDWAETDADGRYEMKGLKGGVYKLVPRGRCGASSTAAVTVSVSSGGHAERDLVVDEGGTVTGRVVDAQGHAVSSVLVRGYQPATDAPGVPYESGPHDDTTDADGKFTLRDVPSGKFVVHVSRRNAGRLRKPGSSEDAEAEVIVHAPETVTTQIVVETGGGRIVGVVLDADGAPAAGVFVTAALEKDSDDDRDRDRALARVRDRTEYATHVVTSADGRFSLSNLADGLYTVRAFHRGGTDAVVEHVSLGSSAKLRIPAGASIEGTVHGRDLSKDVFDLDLSDSYWIVHRREAFYATNGRFKFTDLPAGRYMIGIATRQSSEVRMFVDLVEGEHKTGLDVDLDSGVTVTGRVVDVTNGQPIAGYEMWTTIDMHSRSSGHTVRTDGNGRFRIEHVPSGVVAIDGMTKDDSYPWLGLVRRIGTQDVDVGDIGIVRSRAKPGEKRGELGITWERYPDDSLSQDRQFAIAAIDPSGPSANLDLHEGDVVTTIDGIDIRTPNRSAGWGLLDVPPGTTIQLGLARGPTIAVTAR